jgi:hypothetical protein
MTGADGWVFAGSSGLIESEARDVHGLPGFDRIRYRRRSSPDARLNFPSIKKGLAG